MPGCGNFGAVFRRLPADVGNDPLLHTKASAPGVQSLGHSNLKLILGDQSWLLNILPLSPLHSLRSRSCAPVDKLAALKAQIANLELEADNLSPLTC